MQTMHMARRVAASLPGGTLAAARDSVLTGTVNILAAYRWVKRVGAQGGGKGAVQEQRGARAAATEGYDRN